MVPVLPSLIDGHLLLLGSCELILYLYYPFITLFEVFHLNFQFLLAQLPLFESSLVVRNQSEIKFIEA